MIIGVYYLTETLDGAAGEGRVFSSLDEAVAAYEERLAPARRPTRSGQVALHAKIKVRMPAGKFPADQLPASATTKRNPTAHRAATVRHQRRRLRCSSRPSLGRLLLNDRVPATTSRSSTAR